MGQGNPSFSITYMLLNCYVHLAFLNYAVYTILLNICQNNFNNDMDLSFELSFKIFTEKQTEEFFVANFEIYATVFP